MKSKGPWKAVEVSELHSDNEWRVYDGEGLCIASELLEKEDAKLFAASPYLLQACKAALVSMSDDEHFYRFRDVLHTLRDAIKKAEGES
jgi:hypothetical protein